MEQRKIFKGIFIRVLVILILIISNQVFARKYTSKGYLGVCIEDLSNEERDKLDVKHGVLITEVIEGSPAEKGGILEDDIIQYFNQKKVRRTKDLIRYIRRIEPKTEVRIQLVREGRTKEISVEIGKVRSYKMYGFWDDGDCMIFSHKRGAYLGVKLQELNQDLASYFGVDQNSGALILEVSEDSPAERTDIKSGDIIISIDGEEVSDPEDVQDVLSDFKEGDEIELVVIRNRKEMQFMVALGRKSWYFHMPGHKECRIRKFKDFRDFRIDVPHIEIDIPEIDVDIDLDENFKEKLKQKLDGIQGQIQIKTNLLLI
jgi:serine protease Do